MIRKVDAVVGSIANKYPKQARQEGEHEIEIEASNERGRCNELPIVISTKATVIGADSKKEQKRRREFSPKSPSKRRPGSKVKFSGSNSQENALQSIQEILPKRTGG